MRPPVFIIPLKRTGGTLVNTILGSHSQLGMSYEIYESSLRPPLTAKTIKSILTETRSADPVQWVKDIHLQALRSFVACARRGGLEVEDVLNSLMSFTHSGGDFESIDSRLDFIELLMQRKMDKFNKCYFGGKSKTDPFLLQKRHPEAIFFFILRDGRDALASQLNTGNFKVDTLSSALEWREYLLTYKKFAKQNSLKTMLIRYESLVNDPELILQQACTLIGVPYETQMLNYHEMDLTLLKAPHGHLSHKAIALGLQNSSIGRYRNDLSLSQIELYEEINKDLLEEYGYI